MTPITVFKGRHVAVFGLGSSGLSAARALIAGGAQVTVWDDSEKSRSAAQSENIPVADLHEADWSQFSALVLAPGVPLTHPAPHWSVTRARTHGVAVIGDIELFFRERAARAPDAPFVAVTGTNGKSTTTSLTAHILQHAGRDVEVGGNLGTPILALAPPDMDRVHVIEMSSYQIDLTPSLAPSVGVMLNVTPDHLDRHGDMQRYAFVKSQVPGRADVAVIGLDDDYGRETAVALAAAGKSVVGISTGTIPARGYVAGQSHLYRVNGPDAEEVADLSGIGSLRGAHNAQNAMAAFAACAALGLDDAAIRAGLRSFPGLAHRMEEVGRRGRVLFVNDSKATNADSAACALGSFENIYWIAGGKPKTGGIETLSAFFPRIRKVYLIGEAAAGFAATLNGRVAYEIVETLERAVPEAAQDAAQDAARTGDDAVVLLSPACASFDQFRNFEIRGDRFRALVMAALA